MYFIWFSKNTRGFVSCFAFFLFKNLHTLCTLIAKIVCLIFHPINACLLNRSTKIHIYNHNFTSSIAEITSFCSFYWFPNYFAMVKNYVKVATSLHRVHFTAYKHYLKKTNASIGDHKYIMTRKYFGKRREPKLSRTHC